jgi:hypothetical protein
MYGLLYARFGLTLGREVVGTHWEEDTVVPTMAKRKISVRNLIPAGGTR